MSAKPLRRTFAFVALAATGGTLLAFAHPLQQTPTPATPPPAAPATADERLEALEKQVAEQEKELVRLARLTSGLADGIARLAAAGEEARAQGFESAGPNPAARTALLAGIADLAAAVKEASRLPAPARAPSQKQ